MFEKFLPRCLLATVLGLVALQPACILDEIGEFGVPLPGSVPASTLRQYVAEAAFSAFLSGSFSYCTDYSGLCSDASEEIFSGALLARTITPDNLPIQDRAWFRLEVARKCADNVAAGIQSQVYIYLVSNEDAGDTAADTSGVSVKGFKDSLPGAAIFASGAAEDCLDG